MRSPSFAADTDSDEKIPVFARDCPTAPASPGTA